MVQRNQEEKQEEKKEQQQTVIHEVEINLSLLNEKINVLDNKINYLISLLSPKEN